VEWRRVGIVLDFTFVGMTDEPFWFLKCLATDVEVRRGANAAHNDREERRRIFIIANGM
jgi:hypothetical protein